MFFLSRFLTRELQRGRSTGTGAVATGTSTAAIPGRSDDQALELAIGRTCQNFHSRADRNTHLGKVGFIENLESI